MKVGQIDEQINYRVNVKSVSIYDYCFFMFYILYILCFVYIIYFFLFMYGFCGDIIMWLKYIFKICNCFFGLEKID